MAVRAPGFGSPCLPRVRPGPDKDYSWHQSAAVLLVTSPQNVNRTQLIRDNVPRPQHIYLIPSTKMKRPGWRIALAVLCKLGLDRVHDLRTNISIQSRSSTSSLSARPKKHSRRRLTTSRSFKMTSNHKKLATRTVGSHGRMMLERRSVYYAESNHLLYRSWPGMREDLEDF